MTSAYNFIIYYYSNIILPRCSDHRHERSKDEAEGSVGEERTTTRCLLHRFRFRNLSGHPFHCSLPLFPFPSSPWSPTSFRLSHGCLPLLLNQTTYLHLCLAGRHTRSRAFTPGVAASTPFTVFLAFSEGGSSTGLVPSTDLLPEPKSVGSDFTVCHVLTVPVQVPNSNIARVLVLQRGHLGGQCTSPCYDLHLP
jgi:hypothetical protein